MLQRVLFLDMSVNGGKLRLLGKRPCDNPYTHACMHHFRGYFDHLDFALSLGVSYHLLILNIIKKAEQMVTDVLSAQNLTTEGTLI